MSLTEQIHETIELLKSSDLDIVGYITGSSMLDADFDEWDSVPDVDVFCYTPTALVWAVCYLMHAHGMVPATEGEKLKIQWLKESGVQYDAALQTIKLKHGDVTVNLTWKKWKTTMNDVLSSFDMSIIMVGYDIKQGFGADLRVNNGFVFGDEAAKWSDDPNVAVPNPLRSQDVDRYTVDKWVRQWDRVVKYWNRGYDTRPMARFYIKAIDEVIAKGNVFTSEASENSFNDFVERNIPLRDKMIKWLEDKEDC